MAQVGGNDIDTGAGTKIPIFVFLQNGWRVRPQEANHTLNVTDGVLLVEGGGDPFVNTTGSYVVRINYQQPVQAISFSTGGGSCPSAEDIAAAVLAAAQVSPIFSDVRKVVGVTLTGSGVQGNPWRPA
jgi:hypothetical protein